MDASCWLSWWEWLKCESVQCQQNHTLAFPCWWGIRHLCERAACWPSPLMLINKAEIQINSKTKKYGHLSKLGLVGLNRICLIFLDSCQLTLLMAVLNCDQPGLDFTDLSSCITAFLIIISLGWAETTVCHSQHQLLWERRTWSRARPDQTPAPLTYIHGERHTWLAMLNSTCRWSYSHSTVK